MERNMNKKTLTLEEAIEHVVQENSLPTSWPSIVKQESASLKINLDNLIRKNLSNIAFVTIDGEDAKDFDDAVFCVEHSDGYDLYVALSLIHI